MLHSNISKLLLIAVVAVAATPQNDSYKDLLLHDLKQCQDFLVSTDKYAFDISIAYEQYGGEIRVVKGEYLKYNQYYYTQMDSMRVLRTHTRELTISERDRRMYYKFGMLGQPSAGIQPIDSVYKLLDQALSIEYSQAVAGKAEYSLSFEDKPYKKVGITVNTEDHYIEHFQMVPADASSFQGVEVIDMHYQRRNGRVRLNEDKYRFKHYLIQGKDGIQLSSYYKDYLFQRLN